jgi:hypothetical protein
MKADSQHMIGRRQFLIGASTTLVSAPSIVQAASLMAVRRIIIPVHKHYYGFLDRLRIDHLYRSGKLRGATLTHAIEQGVLDHILRARVSNGALTASLNMSAFSQFCKSIQQQPRMRVLETASSMTFCWVKPRLCRNQGSASGVEAD